MSGLLNGFNNGRDTTDGIGGKPGYYDEKKIEPIEVKPEKLHLSFSEYTLYRSCPFKWFLQYVLDKKEPANEFLIFGSALHKSIEEVILKNPSRMLYSKIVAEAIKKESNGVFSQSYFGKGMINDGSQLLNKLNFHKRFKNWEPNFIMEDNEKKIVGVEELIYEPLVEVEGKQLFFKGFIDFAAKSKLDKRYMVLDWKSGMKGWNIEKKAGKIPFNIINDKLKNKQTLTLEEAESLQAKLFFGQTVLYKYFYSKKYNIPKEDILTRYCVLTRQPLEIYQYETQYEDSFAEYIINDIKNAILEIYEFKKTLSIDLDKAKNFPHLKAFCNYCKLKLECK